MRSFLLLFLTFFISAAFSQNKIFLSGTLKDSISNQPLLFASITNVNTRQTVLSDKKGVFKIAVSQNQLLSFASVGYNFDTVFINEKVLQIDTLHILLSPLTRSLAEVTVYSNMKLSAYQSDSLKRRKEFFFKIDEEKSFFKQLAIIHFPFFPMEIRVQASALIWIVFTARKKRKRRLLICSTK